MFCFKQAHAYSSDPDNILDAVLSVFEEDIFTNVSLMKLTHDLVFSFLNTAGFLKSYTPFIM
jgi:hypothetical protein